MALPKIATHAHTHTDTHTRFHSLTHWSADALVMPLLYSGGRIFPIVRLCATGWAGVGCWWFLWCLRVYVDCFYFNFIRNSAIALLLLLRIFRHNLYLLIWTVGVAIAVVFTYLFTFTIIRIAFGRYLYNLSFIFHCMLLGRLLGRQGFPHSFIASNKFANYCMLRKLYLVVEKLWNGICVKFG